ncbi:MAG: tetratricopeptide repeat protein [Planctomycetota bacterium]
MTDICWVKLGRVTSLFLAGAICCLHLGGCSEPVSTGSNAKLVRNNSELEFQRQADRPPTAKTLYAMAGILATQGKNAQCEFVLNRIIQDYPRFLPAYNSLAEVQMRQGRVNAAIETISGGLRIRPRDPVLLNNLGMCRIVHKDYEKALEAFTEAAGVVPENARYRTNMALALGLMGRYEESLSLFKQVLPEDQANHNLNILREAGAAQGVLPLSPPKPTESDNTSR